MRTFLRHKTVDEIDQQCVDQGLSFNADLYYQAKSDYVVISGGGAKVLFNVFNGNFFGTTPQGVDFDSKLDTHEVDSWFQRLLEFFYSDEEFVPE